MNLDQIPLFAMLKGKLGYLNDRQRVLSQNIANADTPDFAPSDLKAFSLAAALKGPAAAAAVGVVPARTNATHIGVGAPKKPAVWKTDTGPDSEVRLDGNQVMLEEQMMKMTEARLDYESAIGFYQKSVGLVRLATKKPGS